MKDRQIVLNLVRALRKNVPTPIPVKIHLTTKLPPNTAGMASIGPKYGHIHIDTNRPISVQLDTLIHEWAHIRTGWNIKEHHKEFWVDQGRIYEIYLKWHTKNSIFWK